MCGCGRVGKHARAGREGRGPKNKKINDKNNVIKIRNNENHNNNNNNVYIRINCYVPKNN